jgi:Phage protein Gp138 N-terminal domain
MTTQPNFLNLATLLGIPAAALDEALHQFDNDLWVCVPAVVNSFNAATQLAEVQLTIQEDVFQNLGIVPVSVAPLQQVQVGMFRAGGFSITFPVKPGDEGVVIFNDLCINAWKKSGGTQNRQEERRRHDLSDGIFYPMAWSQARLLSGYSTASLQIRTDDGSTLITLGEGNIIITPDSGTTSLTVVAGMITIKAASIVFDGTVTLPEGTILGDMPFSSHTHDGVTSGTGVSGPPIDL